PPNTWGKITGTVLGKSSTGVTAPLKGATVQVPGSQLDMYVVMLPCANAGAAPSTPMATALVATAAIRDVRIDPSPSSHPGRQPGAYRSVREFAP
ncbi:hypothetical protein, partial [Streptomyces sp. NPDC002690]